jgi:hypothetical protein
MLRTDQSLPRWALDTALQRQAFPPTLAVCYRATWQLEYPILGLTSGFLGARLGHAAI